MSRQYLIQWKKINKFIGPLGAPVDEPSEAMVFDGLKAAFNHTRNYLFGPQLEQIDVVPADWFHPL